VKKAFVAGADIAEFADFSVEEGVQLAAQDRTFYSILSKI
jgi:enoyl-CoA hydratase/carnithine racemase